MNTRQAVALVHAVRNRLWLAAGLRQLSRGLWLGAGLLLFGGLYHLFAQTLPVRVLTLLALLPLAASLLSTLLWQRPGTSAAARRADTWFQGHSLITSAWELQGRPAPTPTAALVLQRAETAAAAWRRQVAGALPLRWPQRDTLALLLAGTGLFLLQLPSKGWLTTTPLPGRTDSPAMEIAAYPALRPPAETPSLAAPALPAETPTPGAAPDTASADRPSSGEATPALPLQMDNPPMDTHDEPSPAVNPRQVQASDGGTGAGDQAGQRRGNAMDEAAPLTVQEQAIARRTGKPGQGGSRGTEPDTAGLPPARMPVVRVAAARPVEQPYRADYPPALRRYIARYFQELQATQP